VGEVGLGSGALRLSIISFILIKKTRIMTTTTTTKQKLNPSSWREKQ
jgi:hypothetical protein